MKVIDEDIQTALKFTDKHKQGKPEFTVEDNSQNWKSRYTGTRKTESLDHRQR